MPKGGKRKGAGRPKGPERVEVKVRLSPRNLDWLKAHGGVTKVVNELVEKEREDERIPICTTQKRSAD